MHNPTPTLTYHPAADTALLDMPTTTSTHSHSSPTPTSHSANAHAQNQPTPSLFIVEPNSAHDDNHQHQATAYCAPPIPPPSEKHKPTSLDVPFAFNSAYSQPFDWSQQPQLAEGRRWSLCDPQPASAPAATTMFSQRPWTSSSSSPSTSQQHHFPGNVGGTGSSSAPQPYSELRQHTSADAPGYHGYFPSSSPSSRPSTTSSLSSYASSSHLATPHSGHLDSFFAPNANISTLKKRDSATFYTIAHNNSTDTIVDGRSHHLQQHQQHQKGVFDMSGLGLGGDNGEGSPNHHHHPQSSHSHSNFAPSSAADDSNPFFFARELQSLQVQEHQAQAQPPSRPSSSHFPGHYNPLHPTLQTALASTSPTDAYQFYDYATPPSTAGSTTFFDPGLSLPQPPRPSTGLPAQPHPSVAYLQQGRRDSMPTLSQHHPHQPTPGPSANLAGVSPQGPSPYSLIIENPDPATKVGRPHLCTHCNETFRRIHDAKRHAYGALGIKNYACMGGCGMTFKRSEGRSRHWQREEVAGVGTAVSVSDFFAMNPALSDSLVGSREVATVPGHAMMIWGGYGCEKRHGAMMNGTMEEDRRLRNKARRDRILMIGARAAAAAARKKEQEEVEGGGEMQQQHQGSNSPPQTSGFDYANNHNRNDSGAIGPTRTRRTSYAVSPY